MGRRGGGAGLETQGGNGTTLILTENKDNLFLSMEEAVPHSPTTQQSALRAHRRRREGHLRGHSQGLPKSRAL